MQNEYDTRFYSRSKTPIQEENLKPKQKVEELEFINNKCEAN